MNDIVTVSGLFSGEFSASTQVGDDCVVAGDCP